ncbi:hypothetical protein [Spongiibacter sp.]|uniref:hypothetical protein n=1 Tax=Spongiibacter sp. TaxID=2024860 RepID=UPI00356372DB
MSATYTGCVKGRSLLLLAGLTLTIACSHLDSHYKAEGRGQAPLIAAYTDTDRDGVMDFGDLCPKTPIQEQVDGFGCHELSRAAFYAAVPAGERECAWDHHPAECAASTEREFGNND